MNETRSNSRTKPMKSGGNFKGGEINSLKDSEKTNDFNIIYNKYNLKSSYLNMHEIKKLQTIGYCLRDFDYEHNSKYDCNEYLIYLIHELIEIQEKLEK